MTGNSLMTALESAHQATTGAARNEYERSHHSHTEQSTHSRTQKHRHSQGHILTSLTRDSIPR